jgi:hypothetical protein
VSIKDEKVDWIFSHEGDKETEDMMRASTFHPERPHLVFRIVRNALDNVEANYRYVVAETGKQLNWNKFASEKLVMYKNFHSYWDTRCKR